MAQVQEVKILDDLTGEAGASGHTFMIDGREYEIDLSDDNAERLRSLLDEFIKAGRRVGPGRRQQHARTGTAGNTGGSYPGGQKLSRDETAAIRTWAKANGHLISDRGRIPNAVLTAYEKRDKNKPLPLRDVPYTEARGWLTREGVALAGKTKTFVAEEYMRRNPGTIVEIEQKVKAAG
jgi:hypothetical protein